MRKGLTSIAVATIVALALMPVASAITYGSPDREGHPSVGMQLAAEAYSDGTWAQCSGTLISSTVFLTAAHCGDGRTEMGVSFDSTYVPGRSKVYWGTWHADPEYGNSQGDPHDIAVIVFDKAIRGITPSRLPAANALSTLSGDQRFTSVGFGAQSITQGKGGKQLHYEDTRWVSSGTYNTTTQVWLKISQNPSHGDGGTCYGDSGGPNFLGAGSGETNIVAGTTITGDMWCRSTNVTYRLDTAAARAFLDDFVTLP